ncbi:uncharacterized protein V1510DRAFT_410144 [Dipodascopsis tothii]|uniref:uncharacterized protein n=1 Tax=Dipodascopsis tothii TaxID=44089 RepID=UPI0034CF4824
MYRRQVSTRTASAALAGSVAAARRPAAMRVAALHASARVRADNEGPRKSPFQVFVDTFKDEWNKSKELQDNIKALQDETGRMAESEAYKKAKDAYEKAREGTSTASSATAKTLKKAGDVVGTAASVAWESPLVKGTRKAASTTADVVDKATEPIRQTRLYKDVKDVIDDGSSRRYGGYEDRETRRKRRLEAQARREQEDLKAGIVRAKPATENPEAGTNVVVHKDAAWKESWNDYKASSRLFQGLESVKAAFNESENSFVATTRSITDRIGSFFAETEYAQVVRTFKTMDPSFQVEPFMQEFREFILPEVLDAYVKGEAETLKMWLSEAPYNIWSANAKQYMEAGLVSGGRVLDIRGVDIMNAKILPPSDVPVFVIGCRAQEVHIYRNAKTGELAAGTEDHIQMSTYAMVLTRIPEELDDPETKGWRILELVRGQTRDWT